MRTKAAGASSRVGASPVQGEAPSNLTIPETAVDRESGRVVPLVFLQNAVRYWWVLFLTMTIGGLLGLALSLTRPPVYEAIARFPASIDYTSTGPLTQFEEDTAYNTIRSILASEWVMQSVVDKSNAEGFSITLQDLRKMSFHERRFDVSEFRVRSADPAAANRIAEIWSETGNYVLRALYEQALLADHLSRYLRSLESCLTKAVASDVSDPQCSKERYQDIQAEMFETGKALNEAKEASGGLFVGLVISHPQPVINADQPVLYGRSQLILAGCVIGLLLGVLLIETGLPARWFKKS